MGPSPLPQGPRWGRGLVSQCCSVGGPAPPRASLCKAPAPARSASARGAGRRSGVGEAGGPPPIRDSSGPLAHPFSPAFPASSRAGQLSAAPQASRCLCARRSHGTLQHPFGAGEGQACPSGAQPQVSIFPGRAHSGPVQVWRGPVALCPAGAAWVTVALEQRSVVPVKGIALLWPRSGRGSPRNQS